MSAQLDENEFDEKQYLTGCVENDLTDLTMDLYFVLYILWYDRDGM